ncbi:MAG: hypothetical protein GY818_15675 [Planctomycetaceae bacterium]|nr:hypothetical protein [Planctomycetaceae bacterium]
MKSLYLTPVLFAMTLLVAVQFDGLTRAASAIQESQSTSDNDAGDLERGPMQKIGPPVMQILNLKFDLDRKFIFVDQKSWGEIDTPARQGVNGLPLRITADPISKLFAKVRKSGGMRSSSTSVSGGRKTMTTFGADLSCQIVLTGDRFELRIDELSDPGRTLEVRCAEGTRVLLTGKNTLAMLNQTDVGIMGVLIDGEKVISDSASDYYVLSQKNPELHDKLSAIFRHAGVDLPLGVDEPAVKRVALRMLGSLYSTDLAKLSVLIEQLDAAEFSAREEASKEIEALFPSFEGAILKMLESDELSIEARNRLKIIVKRTEEAQAGDRRAVDCVKANRLLDRTGYLIDLFEIANEQSRPTLVRHLTKTTNQDFGDDSQKWQQWWRETQAD